MGPLATIDFLQKLLAATPAVKDQDHVPMVVTSIPRVPDRNSAFCGAGDSPLPAMIDSGKRLIDANKRHLHRVLQQHRAALVRPSSQDFGDAHQPTYGDRLFLNGWMEPCLVSRLNEP